MALTVDNFLYFASVRPDYQWSAFVRAALVADTDASQGLF
jgi:hypothetical protein